MSSTIVSTAGKDILNIYGPDHVVIHFDEISAIHLSEEKISDNIQLGTLKIYLKSEENIEIIKVENLNIHRYDSIERRFIEYKSKSKAE